MSNSIMKYRLCYEYLIRSFQFHFLVKINNKIITFSIQFDASYYFHVFIFLCNIQHGLNLYEMLYAFLFMNVLW